MTTANDVIQAAREKWPDAERASLDLGGLHWKNTPFHPRLFPGSGDYEIEDLPHLLVFDKDSDILASICAPTLSALLEEVKKDG